MNQQTHEKRKQDDASRAKGADPAKPADRPHGERQASGASHRDDRGADPSGEPRGDARRPDESRSDRGR